MSADPQLKVSVHFPKHKPCHFPKICKQVVNSPYGCFGELKCGWRIWGIDALPWGESWRANQISAIRNPSLTRVSASSLLQGDPSISSDKWKKTAVVDACCWPNAGKVAWKKYVPCIVAFSKSFSQAGERGGHSKVGLKVRSCFSKEFFLRAPQVMSVAFCSRSWILLHKTER